MNFFMADVVGGLGSYIWMVESKESYLECNCIQKMPGVNRFFRVFFAFFTHAGGGGSPPSQPGRIPSKTPARCEAERKIA
jgi:hypothetical protein